jgi:hypothetical protein
MLLPLQGDECLHELADALQQQLEQLEQHQQTCTATTQQTPSSQQQQQQQDVPAPSAGGCNSSSRSSGMPVGHLLLRLDHMRSKASYSRTIKQWAAELSLTGMFVCLSLHRLLHKAAGSCNAQPSMRIARASKYICSDLALRRSCTFWTVCYQSGKGSLPH